MPPPELSEEFLNRASLVQVIEHASELARRATQASGVQARQLIEQVNIAMRVVKARIRDSGNGRPPLT